MHVGRPDRCFGRGPDRVVGTAVDLQATASGGQHSSPHPVTGATAGSPLSTSTAAPAPYRRLRRPRQQLLRHQYDSQFPVDGCTTSTGRQSPGTGRRHISRICTGLGGDWHGQHQLHRRDQGNSLQFNVTGGALRPVQPLRCHMGPDFRPRLLGQPRRLAVQHLQPHELLDQAAHHRPAPLETTGRGNANVGWYVKQITNADYTSDETGGNHYYHGLNLPNNGQWTHVILNMHPGPSPRLNLGTTTRESSPIQQRPTAPMAATDPRHLPTTTSTR